MVTRSEILVRGIVQGVGFRPFVYCQASRLALRGRVRNSTSGVLIEVEGNHGDIEQFISDLKSNPPPLSEIESVECNHHLAPADYSDFLILESAHEGNSAGGQVPVAADVSTCEDCLNELFDPRDRRYQYPFINCTNCGPRFTIVEDIPYDRAQTTMRDFEMCAACRAEYENPLDRRFHAEPIACPNCGPRLWLSAPPALASGPPADAGGSDKGPQADAGGSDKGPPADAGGSDKGPPADGGGSDKGPPADGGGVDNISGARRLLLEGKIIAIKGIGGFHLACDALNREAVEKLRRRKYREDKPFALMAASIDLVRQYCVVSKEEEQLLRSERRPIVLLERKPDCVISRLVAPGVNALGFMLPYSPLHHLLLKNLRRPLVMTSGNISDEPIAYEDGEASRRLSGIADYFLLHDRRIHMRTDDSVVRVHDQREMVVRRSRGYAPAPLKTGFKFVRQILACGAELKNTFCLARDDYAFVSHHIGDLENLQTLRSYTEGIEHFQRLFHVQPDVVAYDLHPEYLSTKFALALDEIETRTAVQHHHAHIASCMADNQIDGEVIGVAMDGLGFGTDGRMWGGEFFVANFVEAERCAHLANIPMPGGAKAIREPWRMAAVYLQQSFGDDFLGLDLPFVKNLPLRDWLALRSMILSRTNSPETSSMGRLFDAVSSLLGVRSLVNYEGQAAIELEGLADRNCAEAYEFSVTGAGTLIEADSVIQSAVADLVNGTPVSVVSARFHLAVARLIAVMAEKIRAERKLSRVVLSGGVFQNLLLLTAAKQLLRARGFQVFTHARVPTNDGGISLGQAAVANARVKSGRI